MDERNVHLQTVAGDDGAAICGWKSEGADWKSEGADWTGKMPYAVWWNLDFITCPTCLASPELQEVVVERMLRKITQ